MLTAINTRAGAALARWEAGCPARPVWYREARAVAWALVWVDAVAYTLTLAALGAVLRREATDAKRLP